MLSLLNLTTPNSRAYNSGILLYLHMVDVCFHGLIVYNVHLYRYIG